MAEHDNMSIDKKELDREGSDDSMDSILEAENADEMGTAQDNSENPAGQQKRKGGRKPIYATSEERKQRNRQAQAAFRERRTEYIKQLEDTIRVHETNLHNLQTAHRSAADECLMLRYKNSLLERILLEKGIDVQAELRAKTGSPHLGPTNMGHGMGQPTVQRAIMNRHQQARRTNSNIAPKMEPGVALQSPQSRPTPSSHASSPTSNSPGFNNPGVMTPPASESQMQHQLHQQHPQQRLQPAKSQPAPLGLTGAGMLVNTGVVGPPMGSKGQGSSGTGSAGGTPTAAAYYPSPFHKFQNHIEQLEQEYESQVDAVDDQDPNEAGPGPYPTPFTQHQAQMNQEQLLNQYAQQGQQPQAAPMAAPQGYSSMDPYDPLLDSDPFGLSASMQFPTQFSFDTSSMR